MIIKRILIISFILLSFNAFSQKTAQGNYYLIDPINIQEYSKSDSILLEKSLRKYHAAKSDTARIRSLDLICSTMEHQDWKRFQFFQLDLINEALKKKPKGKRLEMLRKEQASSYNNIGYIYKSQGEIDLALTNYEKALKMQREILDSAGIAQTLNNLGVILGRQGKLMEALDVYNEALEINNVINEPSGIVTTLSNIGTVYHLQDDFPMALKYYKKALNKYKQLDNKKGIANSYNNIGVVYFEMNNLTASREYNLKSLHLKKKIGDVAGMGESYTNLGRIDEEIGHSVSALEYYEKSLECAQQVNNAQGIVTSYINLSRMKLAANQLEGPNGALSLGEKGLALAKEIGYLDKIKDASDVLYRAYKQKGDFARSLEVLQLYVDAKDSISKIELKEATASKLANFEYEKQKIKDQKDHEKKLALEVEEKEKQKVLIYSLIGGVLFVVLFLVFAFIQLRTTIKQKKLIAEKKEEAERANKIKGEFVANISHELRTPMNAILGFTEILQERVDNDKDLKYLGLIHSSGRSLMELLNDILDLSKIDAGKMDIHLKSVSVQRIIHELQSIFSETLLTKEIEFKVQIDQDVPTALILDEVRLRQILFNLIGNAVKFTDHGFVKLRVSCKNIEDEHSKINLSFEVEDSGIGIAPEQQQLIFNEFEQQIHQDHQKYGGTGLGLAITKRLTEMLRGEIHLESELGKGSKFKVTLNDIEIGAIDEILENEKSNDISAIVFEEALVLAVDDVLENRTLIKDFIEMYPGKLRCIVAENGKRALQVLEEVKPDLVLMDMKMPVMDGYEASRLIKENPEFLNIPVVAFTASANTEDLAVIMEHCDGYIKKPVSEVDLAITLSKFLPYSDNTP